MPKDLSVTCGNQQAGVVLPFRIAAADLIIGSSCAGCERPAISLCAACSALLVPVPRVSWPRPTPRLLRMTPPVEPVASGTYEGVLRSVLTRFKEEGRFGLLPILGHFLAAAVCEVAPPGSIALVPVPSAPLTRLRRGHDAIAELAQEAATSLCSIGVDCRVLPVLVHARRVADQSGLTAGERAVNMAGALRARSVSGLAGRHIVVVDDILTTGATAAEAVRVLTAKGSRPVGVAVVAATPRHFGDNRGTIGQGMEKRSPGGYGQ